MIVKRSSYQVKLHLLDAVVCGAKLTGVASAAPRVR